MLAAPASCGNLRQVLAEDCRKRRRVGEVEISERRDRNIELNRIDAFAKSSGAHALLQDLRDHADQRRMHRFELAGAAYMPRAAAVLVVEQHDEVRVRVKMVERTF